MRLLFLILGFFVAQSTEITLSVNSTLHHLLNDRFISFDMDPFKLRCSMEDLAPMQNLYPAFIRYVDLNENRYFFAQDSWWQKLNNISQSMKLDLIYAAKFKLHPSGRQRQWDAHDIRELASYSDLQHYNLAWQYGYDAICEKFRDSSKDFKIIGEELVRFRSILNSYETYKNSTLIGPDIWDWQQDEKCLKNVYNDAGNVLDALVWHARWPKTGDANVSRTEIITFNIPTDYLKWDYVQLKQSLPASVAKKPLWISQTKSPMYSSFLEGIMFARRLAIAANLGSEVVFKQFNVFSVLNFQPEYWIAVYHKKFMGRSVLKFNISKNVSDVEMTVQCASSRYTEISTNFRMNGGITVYAVNTGQKFHKFSIGRFGLNDYPQLVYEFVMTTENGDIFSRKTYMNGVMLNKTENGTLPILTPIIRDTFDQLYIPPYSVSFWVLPTAKVDICKEESAGDSAATQGNVATTGSHHGSPNIATNYIYKLSSSAWDKETDNLTRIRRDANDKAPPLTLKDLLKTQNETKNVTDALKTNNQKSQREQFSALLKSSDKRDSAIKNNSRKAVEETKSLNKTEKIPPNFLETQRDMIKGLVGDFEKEMKRLEELRKNKDGKRDNKLELPLQNITNITLNKDLLSILKDIPVLQLKNLSVDVIPPQYRALYEQKRKLLDRIISSKKVKEALASPSGSDVLTMGKLKDLEDKTEKRGKREVVNENDIKKEDFFDFIQSAFKRLTDQVLPKNFTYNIDIQRLNISKHIEDMQTALKDMVKSKGIFNTNTSISDWTEHIARIPQKQRDNGSIARAKRSDGTITTMVWGQEVRDELKERNDGNFDIEVKLANGGFMPKLVEEEIFKEQEPELGNFSANEPNDGTNIGEHFAFHYLNTPDSVTYEDVSSLVDDNNFSVTEPSLFSTYDENLGRGIREATVQGEESSTLQPTPEPALPETINFTQPQNLNASQQSSKAALNNFTDTFKGTVSLQVKNNALALLEELVYKLQASIKEFGDKARKLIPEVVVVPKRNECGKAVTSTLNNSEENKRGGKQTEVENRKIRSVDPDNYVEIDMLPYQKDRKSNLLAKKEPHDEGEREWLRGKLLLKTYQTQQNLDGVDREKEMNEPLFKFFKLFMDLYKTINMLIV